MKQQRWSNTTTLCTLLLEQIESSGSPNLCRLQCLWQALFTMAQRQIYYVLVRARAPLNLLCVCMHVIPVSLCSRTGTWLYSVTLSSWSWQITKCLSLTPSLTFIILFQTEPFPACLQLSFSHSPLLFFNWSQCCLECQTMCQQQWENPGCPWHLPPHTRPTVENLYPCSCVCV